MEWWLMQDFKNLVVWQKAHALTLTIYQTTRDFPSSELYGLTSQMRRSAASIPTNLAEGAGRNTNADFARFVDIAMGSASELTYQVMLAKDLNLIPSEHYLVLERDLTEIRKMLAGLLKRLRQ
jgi:four helix bundle protein